MELKRSLDFRKIFFGIYFLCFAVYLIIGLQPAEAANYEISAELSIPSIGLTSDVTTLKLENHELKTPDTIVGSFSRNQGKVLLIGHSSTVFKNLANINVGEKIIYDDTMYQVSEIEVLEKVAVNMNKILSEAEEETMVIMTCAGENLANGDATHRMLVTAVKK